MVLSNLLYLVEKGATLNILLFSRHFNRSKIKICLLKNFIHFFMHFLFGLSCLQQFPSIFYWSHCINLLFQWLLSMGVFCLGVMTFYPKHLCHLSKNNLPLI